MQMSKNVNNDVSKDPLIPEKKKIFHKFDLHLFESASVYSA